jgi:HSP20 family protein
MANEMRTESQKVNAASQVARPEQTRPGPVFLPAVDIFENDQSITVLADMPGVKTGDLSIDLRDNVLTLNGAVKGARGHTHTDVLHEVETGTFFRQFTLSEAVDQSKIDAKLVDGVLRLELPKVERAQPRQITVRTT